MHVRIHVENWAIGNGSVSFLWESVTETVTVTMCVKFTAVELSPSVTEWLKGTVKLKEGLYLLYIWLCEMAFIEKIGKVVKIIAKLHYTWMQWII